MSVELLICGGDGTVLDGTVLLKVARSSGFSRQRKQTTHRENGSRQDHSDSDDNRRAGSQQRHEKSFQANDK
ncbi:MAG: hypothetical protein HQ518_31205 [Rhodopirellula sp.]|nr:hypothetical protein [Rhodopirellula sp.]